MIQDVKSTKMACQDNKRGFLCDQHLSRRFLFLSAVFGYLSEIPPSNKDYMVFAVSHIIFPLNIDTYSIVKLGKSREECGKLSVTKISQIVHFHWVKIQGLSRQNIHSLLGNCYWYGCEVHVGLAASFLYFFWGHAQMFLPHSSSPMWHSIAF